MFCEKCGTLIPENSLFCPSCGAKTINDDSSNKTPSETVEKNAPNQPTTAAPNTAPNSNINSQNNQQQSYSQQSYQYPSYMPDESPLSFGQWLGTIFLQCIPIVGFIMLLVWSFSSSTNVNKKNYARATLVFGLLIIAMSIVLSVLFSGYFISKFYSQGLSTIY